MVAGGLHRFYDSLAIHVAKVRARQRELENEENDENDDDYEEMPLTLKQFVGVMEYFFLWAGIALLFFLFERIAFYCSKRRNDRNIRHAPRSN